MNKRQIIASLNEIANELDHNNLYKEAQLITNTMIKISNQWATMPRLSDFDYDCIKFRDEMLEKISEKDFIGATEMYLQAITGGDIDVNHIEALWAHFTYKYPQLRKIEQQHEKYENNFYKQQTQKQNRQMQPQQRQQRQPATNQQQNMSRAQIAQQWINQMSPSVGGDVMTLYQMAEQGKLKAVLKQERDKFNDAMYLLKSRPEFVDY